MQVQRRPDCFLALLVILAALPARGSEGPQVTQVFGAATLPVNGTTSLTITLTNDINAFTITDITVADTLTSGLVVATPNGLTDTCGGTVTAVAGSNSISLAAGTMPSAPPDQTCVISVNVTATTIGPQSATNGVLTSNAGGGAPFTASITVTAALPTTPAPSSWLLLAIGMLAILAWAWWRRRLRPQA